MGERGGQDSLSSGGCGRQSSQDVFLKLAQHGFLVGWTLGVRERTAERACPVSVPSALLGPVLRGHSLGKSRCGRAHHHKVSFVPGKPMGCCQSWGLHWGWDGVPGQRTVGREEWAGQGPGALDPEVRGKGRSPPRDRGGVGWGGQGLGQNPRSCQESMSVRPQRTCREPPADRLS